MRQFFETLFEHGQVRCGPPTDSQTTILDAAWTEFVGRIESIRRANFPGEAPPFSAEAGNWAAIRFHRASQAVIFRDLDEAAIDMLLDGPPPQAEPVSLHYSVDWAFQFLPDLVRFAHLIADDDPLNRKLSAWANQWPLSSVGMAGVTPDSLSPILSHPGMLQYYVDRILAKRDVSRLSDATVKRAVRRSLSIHTSLFPEFQSALTNDEPNQRPTI